MNNASLVIHSYQDVESARLEDIVDTGTNNPNLSVVIITFLIGIAGIVGNGMVIRILGFSMKRNHFTTYVLNLAVADLGALVTLILVITVKILDLRGFHTIWGFYICIYAFALMYITDQLLLTVISVDRCVAVLFPLWHQCHRPPHLSGILCVSMWVLSLLINGLDVFFTFVNNFVLLQFLLNVAICTPLMAISTIILLVKSCTKSQQRKRGKLLLAISLALFFFLIFGIPVNYFHFVIYFDIFDGIEKKPLFSSAFGYSESNFVQYYLLFSRSRMIKIPLMVALVCEVLNCSINPLIYFLVGWKKNGPSRQSMRGALQRVFKDEGSLRRQEGPQPETQL